MNECIHKSPVTEIVGYSVVGCYTDMGLYREAMVTSTESKATPQSPELFRDQKGNINTYCSPCMTGLP